MERGERKRKRWCVRNKDPQVDLKAVLWAVPKAARWAEKIAAVKGGS